MAKNAQYENQAMAVAEKEAKQAKFKANAEK